MEEIADLALVSKYSTLGVRFSREGDALRYIATGRILSNEELIEIRNKKDRILRYLAFENEVRHSIETKTWTSVPCKIAPGIELNTRIRGRRGDPNIVLIHGAGDAASVWDYIASSLAESFHVVAVDLRGHGDSFHLDHATTDEHIGDLTSLISDLPCKETFVVGHSFGGRLATALAGCKPTIVSGATIIDFGPEISPGIRLAYDTELRHRLRRYTSVAEYAYYLTTLLPLVSPETLLRLALQNLQGQEGNFQIKYNLNKTHTAEIQTDQWVLIRRIAVPTLLVRGAGSAVLSDKVAKRMTNENPLLQLVTLPMCGHSVVLEAPKELLHFIFSFLNKLSRKPGSEPSQFRALTY